MLSFLSRRRKGGPVVPLVRLSGVIGGAGGRIPGRTPLTAAALEPVLESAFGVRGAKAVALTVNSPGGAPVQCEIIATQIRYLAERHDIPVCAFVEDIAASGGYWLACAADEIFANATSIMGSIGVINASFGFQEALERLGVERRVHAMGRHKGMLDPFRAEQPEDVKVLETALAAMQEEFVGMVKGRRGSRLTAEDEDEIFSASVWTGRRALELGLVDGIGDAGSVLRERFGENVRVRDMTPKRSLFRFRSWNPLDSGSWAEGAFAAVEERLLYARYGL